MTHIFSIRRSLSLLFLVTLFCTEVLAEDLLATNPSSPWYAYNDDQGWHFDLGLGIEREPTYAGSNSYQTEPGVFARALYKTDSGHRYFISLGEVGAMFSLSPTIQLVSFLEYEEERNDSEDNTLTGLDTINDTIEAQIMLAKRFGNASLFAVIQPDLAGDANKGLVWFLGASYDDRFSDHWRWSARLDLSGADAEHMQTEFGITPQEAENTGYAAYQPKGALKSASLGLVTEYILNSKWSLMASLETEYYLSEAADSSLISQEGSKVNTEASLQLRWRF